MGANRVGYLADTSTTERRVDQGFSLVEILIAVALMGVAMMAVLATTGVITASTAASNEHAKGHEWLQSASEVLVNDDTWTACATSRGNDAANAQATRVAAAAAYQSVLRGSDKLTPPNGWNARQISVPATEMWFGAADGTYKQANSCDDNIQRRRVVIQVTSPGGKIAEIEIVKTA